MRSIVNDTVPLSKAPDTQQVIEEMREASVWRGSGDAGFVLRGSWEGGYACTSSSSYRPTNILGNAVDIFGKVAMNYPFGRFN